MKNTLKKISMSMVKFIPVIATVMLVVHTNSAASAFNGQPKAPEGLKKYRKF